MEDNRRPEKDVNKKRHYSVDFLALADEWQIMEISQQWPTQRTKQYGERKRIDNY